MAMGSVKEKLVGIETYGNNMKFINQQKKDSSVENEGDETNE